MTARAETFHVDGKPTSAQLEKFARAIEEVLNRQEFLDLGFYFYVSDGVGHVVGHDGSRRTLELSNIRAYIEFMKHHGPHAPALGRH